MAQEGGGGEDGGSAPDEDAIAHRARGGWRRFTAIFLDHRMWTVGFGFLAFVATIIAFATLPMTFQPVTNTDFSQVKIETVPGSTNSLLNATDIWDIIFIEKSGNDGTGRNYGIDLTLEKFCS